MKSPFRIFRKYQKGVMVVMVFVALILFGIGDTLMKMVGGPSVPQGSKVLVETNIGKLSQMQMHTLMNKRRIIHLFIQKAYVRSHPQNEKSPMADYMLSFMVQRMVQYYGFGPISETRLLESWLYRHEAQKLGIVITDKQVEEYIRGFTDRKLSTATFEEIIREMQLGARELFDMLRDEMQAVTAFRMKQPVVVASPEKYWEYYQALNTREKIEVAAVPVKEFTVLTPEPTPAEIAKLFDEHKEDIEQTFEGRIQTRGSVSRAESNCNTSKSHSETSTPKRVPPHPSPTRKLKTITKRIRTSNPAFKKGKSVSTTMPVHSIPDSLPKRAKKNCPPTKPTRNPADNPADKPREKSDNPPGEAPEARQTRR